MKAVFLDRDGTMIEDRDYLREPDQVRLLPGVTQAVARLNDSGLLAIEVTNQSGIGRGLLTIGQYQETERRLDRLLAEGGARLDGRYYCPHLPDVTGPCECRKPGTLLYRQAAERFGIDLGVSWWIGDRVRDVLPSEAFGGRGILLPDAGSRDRAPEEARRFPHARDLAAAVDLVLRDPLASSPMPMRVAVAVSGRGSNLAALLATLGPGAAADVVLALSDRDAPGLALARSRKIPAEVLSRPDDADRWLELLRRHEVDLLVLAGYVKLVPAAVIAAYRDHIINIHPALLPQFGGKGMYGRRVHEAVLASGARESGASVHLVDEQYDRGAVLAQARVPVKPGDTPDLLAERVLEAEHRLLPEVVLALATRNPAQEGRAH